jgi:hypothetical protein
MLDQLLYFLSALFNIAGVPAAILLIALVLAAGIYVLYLLLEYGESAVHLLLPFIHQYLQILRRELGSNKPFVRIELLMHCFFGLVFFFCVAATILHALIPWLPEHTHHTINGLIIASFIILVLLIIPSLISARDLS